MRGREHEHGAVRVDPQEGPLEGIEGAELRVRKAGSAGEDEVVPTREAEVAQCAEREILVRDGERDRVEGGDAAGLDREVSRRRTGRTPRRRQARASGRARCAAAIAITWAERLPHKRPRVLRRTGRPRTLRRGSGARGQAAAQLLVGGELARPLDELAGGVDVKAADAVLDDLELTGEADDDGTAPAAIASTVVMPKCSSRHGRRRSFSPRPGRVPEDAGPAVERVELGAGSRRRGSDREALRPPAAPARGRGDARALQPPTRWYAQPGEAAAHELPERSDHLELLLRVACVRGRRSGPTERISGSFSPGVAQG